VPALRFERALPVEDAEGRVRFTLPGGERVESAAILRCDPERPDLGSVAELVASSDGRARRAGYIEKGNASS